MGSQDYSARSVWVLRCNDIRKALRAIRRIVRERVLFYVPVELLQRRDDIISDLSIINRVRCEDNKCSISPSEVNRVTNSDSRARGINIFDRWESGLLGSRFFNGSELETRELIWDCVSSWKARSPSF